MGSHSEALDGVYGERDQLVALLARWALDRGLHAGILRATDAEPGYQYVVTIGLPQGQVSWHIRDDERGLFGFLDGYPGRWDGHSSAEKYARVRQAAGAGPGPGLTLRPLPEHHSWAIFAGKAASPVYVTAPTSVDAVVLQQQAIAVRYGDTLLGMSVHHAVACPCRPAVPEAEAETRWTEAPA